MRETKTVENTGLVSKHFPNLEKVWLGLHLDIDGNTYTLSEKKEYNSRNDIPFDAEGMTGERPDLRYLENQFNVFLSNKKWLKKFWHLFHEMPFKEYWGKPEKGYFKENMTLDSEVFFQFKDGSEAVMRFTIDGEYTREDYTPLDEEETGSMACQAAQEFRKPYWDLDLITMHERVMGYRVY